MESNTLALAFFAGAFFGVIVELVLLLLIAKFGRSKDNEK